MNPDEYARLNISDKDHWYYSGKRLIAKHWLERLHVAKAERVLEVGIGTGRMLEELCAKYQAVGLDAATDALNLAKSRVPDRLIQGALSNMPFGNNIFSAVIALDVLEHIERDFQAVKEMLRVLAPGGFLLLTVPAFQVLWSYWDESLGHKRRYSRRMILDLALRADAEVVFCTYLNSALFPPILLHRRLVGPVLQKVTSVRAEDHVPPAPVNNILRKLFTRQATNSSFHLPFGTSVFAILKKR